MHSHNRLAAIAVLVVVWAAIAALPYLTWAASWEEINPDQVKAFETGDVAAVKHIIKTDKRFENPYQIDSAFQYAITSGNLELIKYLKTLGWLEVCREAPDCFPIHLQIQKNTNARMIQFFVSEGFDINAFHRGTKSTPLQSATESQNLEAIRFLCEMGADSTRTFRFPNGEVKKTPPEIAKGWLRALTSMEHPSAEVIRQREVVRKLVEFFESGQCKKRMNSSWDSQ